MLSKKPKIEVKPSMTDRKIIRAGWLLVALNFIIVLVYYFKLPETVPIHFDLQGKADGYGPKETLFILPFLNGIIYLGMTLVATKLKPHYMNFPVKVTERNAPKLYPMGLRMLVISNVSSALILLAVTLMTLLVITGVADRINIPLFLGLFFTLILVPFLYIFKMFSEARE